jgi:hypothetical protein
VDVRRQSRGVKKRRSNGGVDSGIEHGPRLIKTQPPNGSASLIGKAAIIPRLPACWVTITKLSGSTTMSAFSDVQELFGGLRTTWSESQGHIVSHAICTSMIFGLVGVTVPHVNLPNVSAKDIMDNDWYQLARGTGLIYLSVIIPLILLSVYLAILRFLGRFIVVILTLLFYSPTPKFLRLTAFDLTPVALTLEKSFTLYDVWEKAESLSAFLGAQKSEIWESHQKFSGLLLRNRTQYLEDFGAFFIAWVVIFNVASHAEWTQANHKHFWIVVFALFALIVLSWLRVQSALELTKQTRFYALRAAIRSIEGLNKQTDRDGERRVEERLQMLLEEEDVNWSRTFSIGRYFLWRIRMGGKGPNTAPVDRDVIRMRASGRPFAELYRIGQDLAVTSKEAFRTKITVAELAAYFYYGLHNRIKLVGKTAWSAIRYIIIGRLG